MEKPRIISDEHFNKYVHPEGVGCALFEAMQKFKDNIAQICDVTGKKQTYSELLERSIRTAIHMKKRNIKEGDTVAICSYNQLDSCVPFIASMFLGCLPASFDPMFSFEDNKHLLSEISPKIMFISDESVDMMKRASTELNYELEFVEFSENTKHTSFVEFLVEVPEEEINFKPLPCKNLRDTCLIGFSSGTTSTPKGICLTHLGFLGGSFDMPDCKMMLHFATLYWISAMNCLISSILLGMTRVICKKYDAVKIWDWIKEYNVDMLFLVPHLILEALNKKPKDADISSLKLLFSGGSLMPRKQLCEIQEAFKTVIFGVGYGQTELSGGIVGYAVAKINEMTSGEGAPVGRVGAGAQIKIVDPNTEEMLGPNQQGELRVKSNFVMNGYYRMDSSMRFDKDGWFKTQDILYYDENDNFYFVDRIRDILKYRQYHLISSMLETTIKTHPAVLDAAVIGIPHEIDGEHPMACVSLKSGYENVKADEIKKYVDDLVDNNKKLRGGLKIIKKFPLTGTSKINKKMLLRMVIEGSL